MRATSGVMAAALLAALGGIPARAGNSAFVDPFIGTAAGTLPYAKGNTFPSAVMPNGMVALSPTRAGISRFTFPARNGGDANVIVDVSHGLTASRGGSVRIVSDREVEGSNDSGGFCGIANHYTVYFVARFAKPSSSRGTWSGASVDSAGPPGRAATSARTFASRRAPTSRSPLGSASRT
jgi:putative alpha-1,2-mannosidase